MQQQQDFFNRISVMLLSSTDSQQREVKVESLANSMIAFTHDPENGMTFECTYDIKDYIKDK